MATEFANRVGGTAFLKVDGVQYPLKGNWTYNLGKPKREGVVGADRVHGFKEALQVPFVEGEITHRPDVSLENLLDVADATVTLELANGKVITLNNAWCAAEGTGNTEEGNVSVRFEGMSADEIS